MTTHTDHHVQAIHTRRLDGPSLRPGHAVALLAVGRDCAHGRFRRWLVLSVLIACALAGCGGSSGKSSTTAVSQIQAVIKTFVADLTTGHAGAACAQLTPASATQVGAQFGGNCTKAMTFAVSIMSKAQLAAEAKKAIKIDVSKIFISGDRATYEGKVGALYSDGRWRLVATQ